MKRVVRKVQYYLKRGMRFDQNKMISKSVGLFQKTILVLIYEEQLVNLSYFLMSLLKYLNILITST